MKRMSEQLLGLERELEWAASMIEASLRLHFGRECGHRSTADIAPPELEASGCAYGGQVTALGLTADQRLVLMLALIPHLRPQLLDPFLIRNEQVGRIFTEFGGHTPERHGGFVPTVETASFVLAGSDLRRRMELHRLFDADSVLLRYHLVGLEPEPGAGGLFASALRAGAAGLALTTAAGNQSPAVFPASFPARRIDAALDWDDLVLDGAILREVDEIRAWIEHGPTLMRDWQLQRHLKPGFRTLFHGPPGTGKSLTAALIGKSAGRAVYRIDLSMVVSKYIGETEKNLAGVFDQAERRDWILFFDEADALFGKRTQTSSAHDRHANQEVAYLLQRLEDFPGIVILATNLKSNIDDAFARRFQSLIYFPMPKASERLRLWNNAFAHGTRLAPEVNLERIAQEFELSGGAIANVLRYASLMCLRRGEHRVLEQDIRQGIRRELWKEGKVA